MTICLFNSELCIKESTKDEKEELPMNLVQMHAESVRQRAEDGAAKVLGAFHIYLVLLTVCMQLRLDELIHDDKDKMFYLLGQRDDERRAESVHRVGRL